MHKMKKSNKINLPLLTCIILSFFSTPIIAQNTTDYCVKRCFFNDKLISIHKELTDTSTRLYPKKYDGSNSVDDHNWAISLSDEAAMLALNVQNIRRIFELYNSPRKKEDKVWDEILVRSSLESLFSKLDTNAQTLRIVIPTIQDPEIARMLIVYRNQITKIDEEFLLCKQ